MAIRDSGCSHGWIPFCKGPGNPGNRWFSTSLLHAMPSVTSEYFFYVVSTVITRIRLRAMITVFMKSTKIQSPPQTSHPPFNLLHNITSKRSSSLTCEIKLINIPIIPSVFKFHPNLSRILYMISWEAQQPVKRRGRRLTTLRGDSTVQTEPAYVLQT